jgi:hypothetical protein
MKNSVHSWVHTIKTYGVYEQEDFQTLLRVAWETETMQENIQDWLSLMKETLSFSFWQRKKLVQWYFFIYFHQHYLYYYIFIYKFLGLFFASLIQIMKAILNSSWVFDSDLFNDTNVYVDRMIF